MAKILVDEKLGERQRNKFSKLEKIAAEIRRCEVCKNNKSGLSVPGEGNPNAKVLFLGEAPGKQEAASGRPFIGRSGQLLRSLIRQIGLDEKRIFITSVVKYLPDRGTPSRSDILHGRVHLEKQLSIIEPKLVVLLGSVASQGMLDGKYPINKSHGTIIKKDGRKLFLTFHPAAALRFPPLKKLLEEDFKKLKGLI